MARDAMNRVHEQFENPSKKDIDGVLLAIRHVGSTDKEKIIWPAGHIGLAVSGRAQKELWPRAVDWLVQRTD